MSELTGFSTRVVSDVVRAVSLADSAAGYTRLEPQSVSGDPSPGLEARVHDPLWLLARQWQLGEFHGEDAGTPIAVHVNSQTIRATVWQPGDPSANRSVRALAADALLDPLVEREPTPVEGPGLRLRAECGAQLLDDLADAEITGVRDALEEACPLAAPALDEFDANAKRLNALLAGRVPDAEAAARDLEAAGGAAPPWLAGANDAATALTVATTGSSIGSAWVSREATSEPCSGPRRSRAAGWTGTRSMSPTRTTDSCCQTTRRRRRSRHVSSTFWRRRCAFPACPPTGIGSTKMGQ